MLERVITGSSGAVVNVTPFDVNKIGGDEVRRQGEWLRKHRCLALPRTYAKAWPDGGYVMEKLHDVPRMVIDGDRMAMQMAHNLTHFIWDKSAESVLNPDTHRALVLDALSAGYMGIKIRRLMEAWFSRIRWDLLEQTLTHGNCGYKNVMIRRGSDVVFIDPIPASTAIPSLKVVDVGHLLKSALGYEGLVLIQNQLRTTETFVLNACNITLGEHIDAAYYWAVVHMMHELPAIDPESDLAEDLQALITSTIKRHTS